MYERANERAVQGHGNEGSEAAAVVGKSSLAETVDDGGGEVVWTDLDAERIGADPTLGEVFAPEVPAPSSDGARQELAGAAAPADVEPGATIGDEPPAGDGGAAIGADVAQIQAEVHGGAAQAQAEATAYKAEMQEQRDRFDAEQQALMLEQLRSMSPTEKRATLADLGFDPKQIQKVPDAKLDGVITDRLESEHRKTKILGMEPEQLAALSPAQKLQFLADLGIDRADLDKAGPAKCAQLFDNVMRLARVPGTHEVKIKVKGGLFGKSWVVTVKCDEGGGVDLQAKKEGGFLSKLVGWIKSALPIVLTVLAPLTGGATLVALSVYQTVVAIQTGNWMGAIVGAAGAVAGIGAIAAVAKSTSGLAQAVTKIANVATKVKTAAQAAQAAMIAAKAKSPGSLLGALAAGAASFAAFASNAAGKFAQTMTRWSERLKKWSAVASGGEKVVAGIQHGDAAMAIGGAFESASAAVGGKTGKDLQRAANISHFVAAGRQALRTDPPSYGAVADAALGIAAQLTGERDVESARRIVASATRLQQAWAARANPAGLAEAALGLAEAIQLAKYDHDHDDKLDADGKPMPDAERTEIVERYQRSTRIVQLASAVLVATTTKPRPSYAAALTAVTQLVAEFTKDNRIDAAAELQTKLDAWTKAVASGDEQAIFDAGVALGQAVDGMRTSIESHRDEAKQEAAAKLAPGEQLPDAGVDTLPPGPNLGDLQPPSGVVAPSDPIEIELSMPRPSRTVRPVPPQPVATPAATPALSATMRDHATRVRERGIRAMSELHAARYGSTGSLLPDMFNNMVSGSNLEEIADLHARLGNVLGLLDIAVRGANASDASVRQVCGHLDVLIADANRLLGRHDENLGMAIDVATGIKWTVDVTFRAAASKFPHIAIAYGALSNGLGSLASGASWQVALGHTLSGGTEYLLESLKIDQGKLAEVVAMEAAKAITANSMTLVVEIGDIEATSRTDFMRQVSAAVARFCEKVVLQIGAKVIVDRLLPAAPSTEGLAPKKEQLVKTLVEAVEDRLETGTAAVLEPLFRALER